MAEKSAEGTPVENMTIKNLRAEVKIWKEKFTIARNWTIASALLFNSWENMGHGDD